MDIEITLRALGLSRDFVQTTQGQIIVGAVGSIAAATLISGVVFLGRSIWAALSNRIRILTGKDLFSGHYGKYFGYRMSGTKHIVRWEAEIKRPVFSKSPRVKWRNDQLSIPRADGRAFFLDRHIGIVLNRHDSFPFYIIFLAAGKKVLSELTVGFQTGILASAHCAYSGVVLISRKSLTDDEILAAIGGRATLHLEPSKVYEIVEKIVQSSTSSP